MASLEIKPQRPGRKKFAESSEELGWREHRQQENSLLERQDCRKTVMESASSTKANRVSKSLVTFSMGTWRRQDEFFTTVSM